VTTDDATVIAEYIDAENARSRAAHTGDFPAVSLAIERNNDGSVSVSPSPYWVAFVRDESDNQPIADYETDAAVIGSGDTIDAALSDLARFIRSGFPDDED
jgi:hypothetical protein